MAPLVDPCPRFSCRSESSITTTKPVTRLRRAPQSDAPPPPLITPAPVTPQLAPTCSPSTHSRDCDPNDPRDADDNAKSDEITTNPGIARPASAPAGDASKAFTSPLSTTIFLSSGLFVTSTSKLPNGSTEVFTLTSSGTRTITTTTEVPTQIGTTRFLFFSSGGPPKGIIGGAIGATVIVALVVFCILRRKRRKLVTLAPKSCAPAALISQSPQPLQITETSGSVVPFPFLAPTPTARDNAVTVKREGKEQIPPPPPPKCNEEDVEDNRDPFQDPEISDVDVSHQEVQDARNTLDRLQQLTNQFKMELQQLSDLARSGQLSEGKRARLEEIRRTAGLTMPFDRGSVSSSEASYSAAPPSYSSELSYS
ncbi:hypothetical protein P691DRAFT_849566 [Macrolepiota fuliginosa MF-IS2]|uniref:Uncharacterized protein n=1 Tax=Macrolepiota fuliginosa MF-IS2 TaxID=1400762 RepID=A0A9P5X1X1_9AGAR|nr:hypothetical protein P691DRAFT_849566 [Macrolepiota fuliginosa MF-IS2]